MKKPWIIVTFQYERCTWNSVGWGHDKKLMEQAKRLINQGETPEEVIRLLEEGGFEVTWL